MPFDQQLLGRYRALYSSIVSDCVEALGLGARVPAPGLAPYHTDPLRVVVGPAHTCMVQKTSERIEIEMLLKMVEATPPNSVVVVAPDEEVHGALWGGLMSAGVAAKGGVGAVVDGGVRDLHQIHPLGFPVFATYRSPLDIRGRGAVVGFGEGVMCRGVKVEQGDLVFADANGVVIIPAGAEADVLEMCEERVQREIKTEEELVKGEGAEEVYSKYGAF